MKTTKLLLAGLLLLSCGLSQAADVVVKGHINNYQGEPLQIVSWDDTTINRTVTVDNDGQFRLSLACRPAVAHFLFGDTHASMPIFLEPGAQIQLNWTLRDTLGTKTIDVDYQGDDRDCYDYLCDETSIFGLWDAWPFERIDTTRFADYREKLSEWMDVYKQRLMKVGSVAFRQNQLKALDKQMISSLFRFAWSKGEKDSVFVNWVESLDHNNPDDMNVASDYLRWKTMSSPHRESVYGPGFFDFLRQTFTNERIINAFANDWVMQSIKNTDEQMDEVYNAFMAFSADQHTKDKATALYDHYKHMKKGAPAPDFTMQDANGKTYSLKDFRGKAVYIDCWATWCGPCCVEIPFMEKLYEHYKGNKKIQLISISLDNSKKAWQRKLATDKPGWQQFICSDNFNSTLCKNYDIDAIPRFMMFDKKGRIISINAPRPSDEEIIEWIDKQL